MASPNTNSNSYANNGDIAAKIFAEYGYFIYGIIRSKVKDQAQADDLYQDFFLSLVSKPIPPDSQNIKGHLYRAIINDIIDANKRMRRYRTLMNKYADYFNFSINKKGPTDAFINEDQMNEIFRVIEEQLSPTEAKAVTLRYRNDCSIEETAKKMNVKKETVSRYICMGLKKIRQFLKVERGNQNDRTQS